MSMTLDAFIHAVKGACGDGLAAAVLYGSAADRDYHTRDSGANVLLLVRRADVTTLRALAPVVRQWTSAGNPAPLVLATAEWSRRADVFAIEYADLLERHRVLHGALPATPSKVEPAHLRHQLEAELMGKLLRFRRALVHATGDTRRLRDLIQQSLPSVLALLRGVIHLHGEVSPESSDDLCARVGTLAGFSPAAVQAALAQRRGTRAIADAELEPTALGVLDTFEHLVRHVDAWRVDA